MNNPCLDIVRAGDKDIFLSTLFAPAEKQPDLFALAAFQVEVNRIPALVSEPQIGEIRLQWWQDTLDAMAKGQAQDHPVAQALAVCITRHGLPFAPLKRFVEAKGHDLYGEPFADVLKLETRLGQTQSAFFQLACIVIAPDIAGTAATASGLGGVAFGLARGLATAGEVLSVAGATREVLAALARQRLAEFNVALKTLPRELKVALLPVSLCDLYLNAETIPPQWRRQWRLWRSAR